MWHQVGKLGKIFSISRAQKLAWNILLVIHVFRVPFLTTNKTWGALMNSGHTVWALFMLNFNVPLTIYQSAYAHPPPPPPSASKYEFMYAERNAIRVPQRTYAVPNFEFRVPFLPTIPSWMWSKSFSLEPSRKQNNILENQKSSYNYVYMQMRHAYITINVCFFSLVTRPISK